MATFYSSFFSSGLLAVDSEGVHRPRTPDPTTPRAFAKSFTDDATPTASTFSSPVLTSSGDALPSLLAQTEAITIASDRPRMRRRRSSLSLSSSPVAPLKGTPPLPRAAVHLQRQSMPVAGRTRSGSVTESISFTRSAMSMASGDATKSNSLMGRLRSGSVGNALRSSSRRMRKPANALAPPPPPTAPLPAPPAFGPTNSSSLPQTPRRPLSRRVHTADGIPITVHTPSITIPGCVTTKEDCLPSSPLVSSFTGYWTGEAEDHATPIDTPGEIRGEYFA